MFRLDLHLHTESRGRIFINTALLEDALKTRRLDGIAVTNFYNISHALYLKKTLKNFIIIVGQEIWTKDGHIIGLGLKERIEDSMSGNATVKKIHAQGGIAVAPHPFFPLGVGRKIGSLALDAVEVYNGFMGLSFYQNYLAQRAAHNLNLAGLASSDTTNYRFVGRSFTEVFAEDRDGILEAICARRVRPHRRPLPVPVGFIAKNILNFKDIEPCPTHAVPCYICGRSMVIRLTKRRSRCIDCGREEYSRILCSNGHYLCLECIMKRGARSESRPFYCEEVLALKEGAG